MTSERAKGMAGYWDVQDDRQQRKRERGQTEFITAASFLNASGIKEMCHQARLGGNRNVSPWKAREEREFQDSLSYSRDHLIYKCITVKECRVHLKEHHNTADAHTPLALLQFHRHTS